MRDDHFAEDLRRQRLAFGLQGDALVAGLDEARAHHSRRDARRRQHVGQRQVVGQQPVRQHLDLQLPHLAAEGAALGHARHRQQPRLERPIRKGAQLHRRQLVRDQADLEQVHRRGGQRRHARRLDAGGQLARRLRQLFGQHLAGAEHVRAFLEHGGDDRQALDGLGAQRFHVAQAVDRGFDRQRDEQFDLLRRQARALGLDHHLRLDEIREDIQLGVAGDVDAVAEQHARQRHHHAAVLEGEMDEGLEHLRNASLRISAFGLRTSAFRVIHSPPAPLSSIESNCCAPVTTT